MTKRKRPPRAHGSRWSFCIS